MKRILIANRGEIARRVIATARRMGIATVAVHSDADANAPHVREATQAFALGGNTSAESYLRIDKLLAAAQATGADAVHPGYGFLSEDAGFAQAVIDTGLTWIGPPPAAIRALGDKGAAKALAVRQGVPVLPGYAGVDQSPGRFAQEAETIGYPVMVKAVAGGGGRGMRLVNEAAALPAALHSARSEALASFGSDELLIERALLAPRHVEVQIFADAHGHCIALGERDCSVQRRHQKIIEESPSPAVDAALRGQMFRCATALAQAAGYVGAGTVEFLLDAQTTSEGGAAGTATGAGAPFFLMEMNTRLQVEHPVTEMLTGLDLVEWQLRVARGEPLPLTQEQVVSSGHAIEVRLCAEDGHFVPHSGSVRHFCPAPMPAQQGLALRFDHAIEPGLQVPPWYDSMLGKLIVHAPSRGEAIDHLAQALDHTELLGLPTNRALLAACLRHAAFRQGQAGIAFLAEQGDGIRQMLQKNEQESIISRWLPGVLALNGGTAGPLACPYPRPVRLRHRGQCSDTPLHGPVAVPAGVVAVRVEGQRWHVQHAGVDFWVEDASFDAPAGSGGAAGSQELRAPFNGRLLAAQVRVGERVQRGQTLLVLESMKLEHSLAAPCDGVVLALHAEPGQQVAPGQLLLGLGPLA
ncbi:MAG: ATP-grasp domain-containing protein [Burkholderiales bacterium]|nr:ATP-grasp domain-containing protein [Burkholderiales bacterium]